MRQLLQKFSSALLLPVIILPVAAVYMVLGDQLGWAPLYAAGHSLLVTYLPLLFAAGVALGFTGRDGMAALAAVVGYAVMASVSRAMDPTVDTGVLGGIAMGAAAALLFQRFHDLRLPEYLGLFSGKRFVLVASSAAGLVAGTGFGLAWPPIGRLIVRLGEWLYSAGATGAFVYGVLNRLLIPTGLHHILNNLIMYVLGGYPDPVTGQVVLGEVPRFYARDPSSGYLLAGFYLTMVFAVPAICLAIAHEARPEQRTRVTGIMVTAALTSIITGITEPAEFAFMFVAPVLFLAHALLTGAALWVTYALGVRHFGMALPMFFINLGYAGRAWLLLPLGVVFGALYYLLFRFLIRRWDLPLLGRTPVLAGAEGSQAGADVARLLEALGGAANIVSVDACLTRLRVELVDAGRVDEGSLYRLGASGVSRPGACLVQVVMGSASASICDQLCAVLAQDRPAVPLLAPLTGRLMPLSEVPDPVFSAGTMGPGVGIDPSEGRLVAPADGRIEYVFPGGHALTMVTGSGLELILHLGIDTVRLAGEGFTVHVEAGKQVETGELLVEFEQATLAQAGLSPISLLIVANAGRVDNLRPAPPGPVRAGRDPVMRVWLKPGNGR
ncbi:MAG: glucose PTS transporter subunit IIA [Bacillota bacterium]